MFWRLLRAQSWRLPKQRGDLLLKRQPHTRHGHSPWSGHIASSLLHVTNTMARCTLDQTSFSAVLRIRAGRDGPGISKTSPVPACHIYFELNTYSSSWNLLDLDLEPKFLGSYQGWSWRLTKLVGRGVELEKQLYMRKRGVARGR